MILAKGVKSNQNQLVISVFHNKQMPIMLGITHRSLNYVISVILANRQLME